MERLKWEICFTYPAYVPAAGLRQKGLELGDELVDLLVCDPAATTSARHDFSGYSYNLLLFPPPSFSLLLREEVAQDRGREKRKGSELRGRKG